MELRQKILVSSNSLIKIFEIIQGGWSCGVMGNELDCGFAVREFKPQSLYYFQLQSNTFGKSMNTLMPQLHVKILSLPFNFKDGFLIE